MQLSDIIINKIKYDGPISFHDYMEMCLYFPELGYYMTESTKIGKSGDYLTSPLLSPVFGELIGKQLEEMWRLLGEKPFTIVEYGAGTGALCCSILNFLKCNTKLYNELNYCIIEKSPTMRSMEQGYLNEKVSWHESIHDISNINGCILSNELVDNLSTHRVVMKDGLKEVFVDYKHDFIEILRPARKELIDYLAELKVNLPEGYRTEINLNAINWIKEIGTHLKTGYVLTIDYGNPSFELYNAYRKDGTLICYNKHRINSNPYNNIGIQDITSHVNFSALCLWGFKNGLDYCGFTDQLRFLVGLGFSEHIKKKEVNGEDYLNYKKEMFLTQTLLKDMGPKFKILVQQKNVPKYELMGLKNSL
jgi:SAM-dependent MidA family methyltransferase